jgi:co-chaperonin GroES (HSP10)
MVRAGVDWVIVAPETASQAKARGSVSLHLPDETRFMEAVGVRATVVSAGSLLTADGLTEPPYKDGDTVIVSLVGSIRLREEGRVLHAVRYSYIIAIIEEEAAE